MCKWVHVQRGMQCSVVLHKNLQIKICRFCVRQSNTICVSVQERLVMHTHNDMQMILGQSDANGFIITKDIGTVQKELQT